jgi:hypothetical protein
MNKIKFETFFDNELNKKEIHPIHKFIRGDIRKGKSIPEYMGYFYIYSKYSGEIIELTEENLELDNNNHFVVQCGNFDINQNDILKHLKINTPHIELEKHAESDEFLGDVEIVYEIKINTSLRPKNYIKLDNTNIYEKYNNIIGNIGNNEYELDKKNLLKMDKYVRSINLDLNPGQSITVLIFHETDDVIQYIAHYNNNFNEDASWVKKLENDTKQFDTSIRGAPDEGSEEKAKLKGNLKRSVRFEGGDPYIYTGGVPYIYTGVTYIYLIQIARTVSYITYYNYSETCKNNGEDTSEVKDCNIRHILKTCVVDFAISILSIWILVELRLINTDTLETALTVIVLTWLALSLLRLASLAKDKRPSLVLKTVVTMVVLLIPLIIIR